MRALVLACLTAATVPLSAITIKPLSFTELVAASTAIVYGRVSDVRGQWTTDRSGIESLITLEVVGYLKGGLGPRVTVRVPGGEAGGIVNIVPGAPRFATGDAVVLFLRVSGPAIPIITGTTQGVYRVTYDPGSGAARVVPPLIDGGPARLVRGDLERRPLSLAAFSDAVSRAEEVR